MRGRIQKLPGTNGCCDPRWVAQTGSCSHLPQRRCPGRTSEHDRMVSVSIDGNNNLAAGFSHWMARPQTVIHDDPSVVFVLLAIVHHVLLLLLLPRELQSPSQPFCVRSNPSRGDEEVTFIDFTVRQLHGERWQIRWILFPGRRTPDPSDRCREFHLQPRCGWTVLRMESLLTFPCRDLGLILQVIQPSWTEGSSAEGRLFVRISRRERLCRCCRCCCCI